MDRKLEEQLEWVRGLMSVVSEENRQYVLTKDDLLAVLDGYSALLESLEKLQAEQQRMEFLLAEYRLVNLGLKRLDGHIN